MTDRQGNMVHVRISRSFRAACLALAAIVATAGSAAAQQPLIRSGDPVPRDVRELYDAGCRFLAKAQDPSGVWKDNQQGPGVTGMALMVLLASGEDPNDGAYRTPVRRALRSIIASQDRASGFYGGTAQGHSSMYHHGFAMLAVAEAYGVVDDRTLWTEEGGSGKGLSLGESLELAVKLAVTSARKNPRGAWRYSPDATDHDTSVSGAILMGLLGARNAGIEVPDETIDKAIKYFTAMTGPNGMVGYMAPNGGSDATTSIGTLVMAIARRKDLPQFKKAADYLTQQNPAASQQSPYPNYTRYYRAQALFQADVDAWRLWNDQLVRQLKAQRQPDGSLAIQTGADGGQIAGMSLTLLSLAVNFRFLPIYER
ncbi:MAG: DUF6288 domain-containing protein [Planctomycetia bacterium]